MKNKKLWIFLVLIVVVMICNHIFGLSKYFDIDNLSFLSEMAKDNMALAVIVYLLFTVVGGSIIALPGITFAIIAGLVFGPWFGTFICCLAATMGAGLSFIVGRFFLKESIKPKAMENKYLKKWLFDESGRNQVFVLMITRLVPLFPFNLQNYAYGVTDIGFLTYFVYSFIFMIPGTAMYTVGMAGIADKNNRWLYIGIAIVLAIAVIVLSGMLKKRYVNNDNEEGVRVCFPGCNFAAYYPKTFRKLADLLKENNIRILHGCCGLPTAERGDKDKVDANLMELKARLDALNATELILICPNCYYYLRDIIGDKIKVSIIYDVLQELGIDYKIKGEGPMFFPCPDRKELLFYNSIMQHVDGEFERSSFGMCCGLRGDIKNNTVDKDLKHKMAKKVGATDNLCVYCGSCAGQLSRHGAKNVHHIMGDILKTGEAPDYKHSKRNRTLSKLIK